jgi:hypothetical protein
MIYRDNLLRFSKTSSAVENLLDVYPLQDKMVLWIKQNDDNNILRVEIAGLIPYMLQLISKQSLNRYYSRY